MLITSTSLSEKICIANQVGQLLNMHIDRKHVACGMVIELT